MNKFNGALCLYGSPNLPERPSNKAFLILLALALTLVAGYAVHLGGTVTADLTLNHLRLEVAGSHK